MSDLTSQKCIPCETYVPPLLDKEENELIKEIPDWQIDRSEPLHKLTKTIEFKDFKEAIAAVNKIADLAEIEGNHPNISIVYNKVTLTLYTHFIKGLHHNDFILAAKINELIKD